MQIAPNVFKAYDIRGIVGSEMTEDLAFGVGRALADFLSGDGPVAVGYDMRPESAIYAQRLREGIIRQGREVWDIGLVTTDMAYFAAGQYGLAGAAMVTASHNPGQYNGIKLCREGAAPIGHDSGLGQIRQAIEQDNFKVTDRHGTVVQRDIVEDWISHALSFVHAESWPTWKVAVDAGNGMAGLIIPRLEPKLPEHITELFFKLDGTFPNHPANPHIPDNLRQLDKAIQSKNLDFGVAFDGDGDRAVLVDEEGIPVPESAAGAALAEYFLAKEPGAKVIYDVRTSKIVPDTVAAGGGQAIRSAVGGDTIKAKLRATGAVLGIEASGHYYFRDNYHSDSGLIAALLLTQILSDSKLKPSQLAKKYQKYFNSGEINLEVSNAAKVLEDVSVRFGDGQQDRLDGLTVNYSDWWFNARLSNTEPYLRLNVEAKTEHLLEQKVAELTKLIKQ
jgi:phosphomannomutase